jgi:diacylglycerol kinase family enzyme
MAGPAKHDSAEAPIAALGRLAVVMNERSGALLGGGDPHEAMRALFAAHGLAADFVAREGTLPERIASACASGAGCVVVAGGDGSIACAAQLLAGTQTVLGLIPSGTMNLLAKDLGIDAGDPARAVSHLASGQIRDIDAGEVGGHIFLCASMLGTPARLSRHREASRRRGNGVFAWAGFARAAWRAWRLNANLRLTLRHDGGTLRVRSPAVTITVNPLTDDTGRAFGRACLDGGYLSVYIVPALSPWRQIGLLLHTAASGGLSHKEIMVLRTTRLEINATGAALLVLVDGESRLIKPPLRYCIRPAALRVVAPAA